MFGFCQNNFQKHGGNIPRLQDKRIFFVYAIFSYRAPTDRVSEDNYEYQVISDWKRNGDRHLNT